MKMIFNNSTRRLLNQVLTAGEALDTLLSSIWMDVHAINNYVRKFLLNRCRIKYRFCMACAWAK